MNAPSSPRFVLYAELRGEDAAVRLRPLLTALSQRPGFAGGELLLSPAQAGLALVQARFHDAPPEPPDLTPDLPDGTRTWTFVVHHALPGDARPLQ